MTEQQRLNRKFMFYGWSGVLAYVLWCVASHWIFAWVKCGDGTSHGALIGGFFVPAMIVMIWMINDIFLSAADPDGD